MYRTLEVNLCSVETSVTTNQQTKISGSRSVVLKTRRNAEGNTAKAYCRHILVKNAQVCCSPKCKESERGVP